MTFVQYLKREDAPIPSILSILLYLLFSTQIEYIKIYIGQLPLAIEQQHLKEILEPLAEIKELKIVRGDNTRGKFDLFCYAFVTMKGNQAFAHNIIRMLQEKNPSWKMNVKFDTDRLKNNRNPFFPQRMDQPPPHMPMHPMPFQHYPPQMQRPPFNGYGQPPQMNQQFTPPMNNMNVSQKIVGVKPCRIFVRELWLGGIPEKIEKNLLAQIMSYYGIIEEIEMFPKFAFIKYKQAGQATNAFERAEQISSRLGNSPGFRIFFSDPSRRAYIVSNNHEYDRKSPSLPILFVGFPPVTSATVEMQVIKPVCERFGTITSQYMRKNSNSQNRSYFLFTYDNLKTAIRAKQQLNRRKDMLGDKRAEVVLLLDEEVIMKDHDLSYTQKIYQDTNYMDKNKRVNPPQYFHQDPNKGMMQPMQMNPMYGAPMGYPNHFMPYYQPPPGHYMYNHNPYQNQQGMPPPMMKHPQDQQNNGNMMMHHMKSDESHDNIHDLLKDVLSDKSSVTEKKPSKPQQIGRQEDILSKLLGNEAGIQEHQSENHKDRDDREPVWSGFLTWKGMKRVAVDGYSQATQIQLQDYAINIISLILFKDIQFKDKNILILEPSNQISANIFKQYTKNLQGKIGVAINSKSLMYVIPKSPESDQICWINNNQLLVILEKISLVPLIKDKLIKFDEQTDK